jgi:hypothetical protein
MLIFVPSIVFGKVDALGPGKGSHPEKYFATQKTMPWV